MKKAALLFVGVLSLASCGGNLLIDANEGIPEPGRPVDVYLRGLWMVGGQQSDYFGTAYPFGYSNHVAQLDVFDPVAQTWHPDVTSLPVPVTFPGVAAYKGKIYVSGGWDSKGQSQDILQIYDIRDDSWSMGQVMPFRRAGHSLIAVERGFLYATPGHAYDINYGWGNYNQFYLYDTYSGLWTARQSVGVTDAGVVNVRGLIHVFGGRFSATAQWNNHDAYLPQPSYSADAATGTTEVARALIGPTAASWTNPQGVPYVLSIGGISGALTGTPLAYVFRGLTSSSAQLVDTLSYLEAPFEAPRPWTDVAARPLPVPLAFGQGIVEGDVLYIFGGTRALPFPSGEKTVHRLDLSGFPAPTASWGTAPDMPVRRFGHRVVKNLEM